MRPPCVTVMTYGAVRFGCPVWAHEPWVGRFFTHDARREDFLPQYASVFGAAEGNSTFYGLPAPATVARWAAEAPDTFRFCFKFPKAVSHEAQLIGTGAGDGPLIREFLERLAPLGPRRGPLMLQLHSSFGPARLGVLREWLNRLPIASDGCIPPVAVEVRHLDFFSGGAAEDDLHAALVAAGAERCVFDTRGLFAAKIAPADAASLDAVRRKPRVPARFTALGKRPVVRFVGDPDLDKNGAYIEEWAGVLARWLDEGRVPMFFVHHPEDVHAPELARRFQARLHARRPELAHPPAAWPCETSPPQPEPRQLGLF
jgi:uncharacterized protein YecE (DUF72 family)